MNADKLSKFSRPGELQGVQSWPKYLVSGTTAFCVLLLYGISTRFPVPVQIAIGMPLLYLSVKVTEKFTASRAARPLGYICLAYVIVALLSATIGANPEANLEVATYILFIFLPSIIIAGVAMRESPSYAIAGFGIASIVLGLILFVLIKAGILASNRYQHVGNCLAAGLTYLLYSSKHKAKYVAWLIGLVIILLVGSRQGLLATLLAFIIHIGFSAPVLTISAVAVAGTSVMIVDWRSLAVQAYDFAALYDIRTLQRLLYKLVISEEKGEELRSITYDAYINDLIDAYPNLLQFDLTHIDTPHNFFLEIIYSMGYIIGIPVCATILFYSLSIARRYPWAYIGFLIVYFVPFNVSTGFAAAKYFLFYLMVGCIGLTAVELNKNVHE